MNVHVTPEPLGQPTPGSARPGNLYADLQSRTLWLGVSLDVDSNGSVLISDMLALMDDIEAAETNAKLYTDGQIATRAPLVHTHTAAQVTDFTNAVTNVVTSMPGLSFNKGTILMFFGDPTDIGVNEWVGWAVCNGENGTPNLTDRFPMGYSGPPTSAHGIGKTNTLTSAYTNEHNGHTHPPGNTALTLAQLPAHSHPGSSNLKGSTTGSITPGGTHNHYITMGTIPNASGSYRPFMQRVSDAINVLTETEPNHSHGISSLDVVVNVGATGNSGSGAVHSHPANTGGAHSHTVSTITLREIMPFYALAFVIKL
jgi:hypothetical protein